MSWTAASYGEPTVRKKWGGGAVMVELDAIWRGEGWRFVGC